MTAKIMGGTPPCTQTRHRGRVNSSALRWPQRTALGKADISRCYRDSPAFYKVADQRRTSSFSRSRFMASPTCVNT